MTWEELTPPYATIVADPPWHYEQGGSRSGPTRKCGPIRTPPYSTMTVEQIGDLRVDLLAAEHAHLYLWTTNRYLRDAYAIADDWWGFTPSQLLTWCKTPKGMGPGGAFVNATEFVLFCRRGSLKPVDRVGTNWWHWPRRGHSVKPPEFFDLVERVSPGPYVELFARQPRLGWDHWGYGYEAAS